MIMDFKSEPLVFEGGLVQKIEGFADGSFTASVLNGEKAFLVLFDAKGQVVAKADALSVEELPLHRGATLGKERILLLSPTDRACNLRGTRMLSCMGTVLRSDGIAENTGFDDFKLFANGWYELCFANSNKLFNEQHQLMAEGFERAYVFDLGYALTDKYDAGLHLFSVSGVPMTTSLGVEAVLGNGNLLIGDAENHFTLFSFTGKELCQKPIVCFKQRFNGCFELTFSDGLSRMYDPDGNRLTIEVRDATLLADGCFVQYDGKLIVGIYNETGIVDKREIYSFEQSDDYYLLNSEFESGVLYDRQTHCIGKDYVLLKQGENFALFEHDGNYELFNQFGLVASFDSTQA